MYYSTEAMQSMTLQKHLIKIDELVRDLPEAEGARSFIERFTQQEPRAFEKLKKQEGLFSDILALAAWSPLLATTILQHTDYVGWLGRERANTRVRTCEEFVESLARFSLTNSQLDPHVLLSRFRRRELLRIYLHDIRKTNTLVEITEELSNLADAILQFALNLSQQQLDNLYGKPLRTDKRGRATSASFSIVALGKLGSHELNYASDIDLLFLYSNDGNTSGQGERGEVTNRQYFVKLAEAVTKLVGQPAGEGAAYRVDLRLRPHGRDGVLASSLNEAVSYYREKAHAWELQAMIRARASAGDSGLFSTFATQIKEKVYAKNVSVDEALYNVKLSKQKIDRHHNNVREGFNVKLGHGGIREIEFIAQALQLAYGGSDEWLRVSHTLLSLGRLTERKLITERERVELFAAYDFLRTLEHRLQMENGLQTHNVPDNAPRRLIIARRMGFRDENALDDFNKAVETHTDNVSKIFERIFGKGIEKQNVELKKTGVERPFHNQEFLPTSNAMIEPVDAEQSALALSAKIFLRYLSKQIKAIDENSLSDILRNAAKESLNSKKSVRSIARVAASLEKSDIGAKLSVENLKSLVALCGVSDYFGEIISSNPYLISLLPAAESKEIVERDYKEELENAITSEEDFRKEIGVFRKNWAGMIIEIGSLDSFANLEMRESNRLQTKLAESSLDVACLIAEREMERRYGKPNGDFHFAVLGLGRLGGKGMDYGSDLDVVLVYDDEGNNPYEEFSLQEIYSKYTELFVSALSSLTREGSVYRVDLRLRPDGKNGATCTGANSFLNYLSERAAAWEWLAYVKLRFAAGDSSFGKRIENEARKIIHQTAKVITDEQLRSETRRVRERLEKEKTKQKGSNVSIDIKYGAGGMLDVYFASRYLQLRDNVADEESDRSTKTTLERLFNANSIDEKTFRAINDGYIALREIDHNLRLIVGRSSRLPSIGHPSLEDVARRMKYDSSLALIETVKNKMRMIREAYNEITD